jgi:alcohol dehydrogenase (cytochrome c)
MKQDYEPGIQFDSGSTREILEVEPFGAVKALDFEMGQPRWQFKLKSTASGGLLSTAGDLFFEGTSEGHFFELDAMTGRDLWRFQTGGSVTSNPISFEVGGGLTDSPSAGSRDSLVVRTTAEGGMGRFPRCR